jgi:preprotein translocase subunit YajC
MMHAEWIHTLIGMAPAQGGEANPYSGFIMLAIMFAIFYFLLIRPQQKKMKEHQAMLGRLERGDEVITSGGLLGKVTAISDNEDIVTLQVADNVKVRVQKSSIQIVKGTGADEIKAK